MEVKWLVQGYEDTQGLELVPPNSEPVMFLLTPSIGSSSMFINVDGHP